ncbi:flagellar hook-length control protein FliK [Peptococcaceae bacterium]|nr:flagellar hook-length control protein FliK [Peptococcaceae bacterium]
MVGADVVVQAKGEQNYTHSQCITHKNCSDGFLALLMNLQIDNESNFTGLTKGQFKPFNEVLAEEKEKFKLLNNFLISDIAVNLSADVQELDFKNQGDLQYRLALLEAQIQKADELLTKSDAATTKALKELLVLLKQLNATYVDDNINIQKQKSIDLEALKSVALNLSKESNKSEHAAESASGKSIEQFSDKNTNKKLLNDVLTLTEEVRARLTDRGQADVQELDFKNQGDLQYRLALLEVQIQKADELLTKSDAATAKALKELLVLLKQLNATYVDDNINMQKQKSIDLKALKSVVLNLSKELSQKTDFKNERALNKIANLKEATAFNISNSSNMPSSVKSSQEAVTTTQLTNRILDIAENVFIKQQQNQTTVMRFKLHPEYLGEVTVRMIYKAGLLGRDSSLNVQFYVSNALAKDAVESILPQIRDALFNQLKNSDVSIFYSSQNDSEGNLEHSGFKTRAQHRNDSEDIRGLDEVSGNGELHYILGMSAVLDKLV